jgi:hypothetical protein
MSKWAHPGDPEGMNEARETMDAMVEGYHPKYRPAKWRELAKYAERRAAEVHEHNEQFGVPDQ